MYQEEETQTQIQNQTFDHHNLESLHNLFLEYGWSTIQHHNTLHNHITYIKHGYELDFFDVCFYENQRKIVVTIPIKNGECQYKCTFYNNSDASYYIEKRLRDYMRCSNFP
jgi:hypothetical protein